ncbi:CotS family spore coat protein [Bacillus hwajinpoensis]|uniref:CotS family spore coat protein n=1 Tax=Guptibacillus hwajinpoensis TaxID=208199 RepID=A0A845EYF8_9BACL|nr:MULTISPECIES: CotS family spore coat protein [Bacillaceae]MYL63548.1 CotS family spore coat protein [Pseudalkalibacillus hwajinpoensis]
MEELKNVLSFYPIEVKDISLLFSRGGRTKWIIESNPGSYVLKQEYIRPDRMLYIAGAHWHLQENGLPIARLIPTKNNGLCLSGEDHAYVLYEHFDGEPMLYYDTEQVMKTMAFIGQFHHASKGYKQPDGSKKRSRIDKWHKLYRWKIQELEGYQKLAANYLDDPFSILFLENVDRMLTRARESLAELDQPHFSSWTKEVFENKSFCQQDFTMARMIEKDERAFMKDLHSVNADLPARDLRILLNKVMKKLAVWDDQLATEMLINYDQVHPLTEGQYRVVWSDLKFPHLFSAIAHKYYLSQKRSWSDEKYMMHIRNVVSVENSKEDFLHSFDETFQKIKGGSQ